MKKSDAYSKDTIRSCIDFLKSGFRRNCEKVHRRMLNIDLWKRVLRACASTAWILWSRTLTQPLETLKPIRFLFMIIKLSVSIVFHKSTPLISAVFLGSKLFYWSHVPGGKILLQFCSNKQSLFQKQNEKNAFLTVFRYFNQKAEIYKINQDAPSGGMIGAGNSELDKYVRHYKVFRVYAVYQDAYRVMRPV